MLGLFFQASMATIQHGMAARSAETAIGPGKPLIEPVSIEAGAGSATFALTRVDVDREVAEQIAVVQELLPALAEVAAAGCGGLR